MIWINFRKLFLINIEINKFLLMRTFLKNYNLINLMIINILSGMQNW